MKRSGVASAGLLVSIAVIFTSVGAAEVSLSLVTVTGSDGVLSLPDGDTATVLT